ncbi:MAG: hypothetical protein ACI85F_000134 [Bacteroidia bacterium]
MKKNKNKKMKAPLLFSLFIIGTLTGGSALAQDKPDVKKATDSPKVESEAKTEPIKTSSNVKSYAPHEFKLNVHAGGGFNLFMGDIADNASTNVHRIGNRFAYHFGIGATLTPWLDLNANVIIGRLNGNERSHEEGELWKNRNFEAKTFAAGLELSYNFKNIGFFRDPRVMVPFVGAGAYFSTYDVYIDKKVDSTGDKYHYWSDGRIMSEEEDNLISDNAQPIVRDFLYESKEADSPVKALAIPVFGGFDFNIDRNWAFRLKAAYFFTLTDAIDGYDDPQHSDNLDGYFYTSASVFFKFNPFKKRAAKGEVPLEYVGDFGPLINEDTDKDGVVDFLDKCNGTPTGVTVNSDGCALDSDNDGIPDYRDNQKNTVAGYIVDEHGVAISYKNIYEEFQKDTFSILRRNEWLYSQPEKDPQYTVHVGTFTNYDIPTQLKMKLSSISGLVERNINDSVSVFTLGSFNNFEAAEAKQNQLIKSGIDQAFGVNENAIKRVADDMKELRVSDPIFSQGARTEKEPDILNYGVELKEYRLRLDINRLSSVIAKYGVEMRSTPGGIKIYRIGSFNHFDEAEKLRKSVAKLGVKNPQISPRLNDRPIDVDKAKELESTINPQEEK